MQCLLVAFYVMLWSLAIASPVSSGTPYNNFNDSAYSEPGRITDMRGHYPYDFTEVWRTKYVR